MTPTSEVDTQHANPDLVLVKGDQGAAVAVLKKALRTALGAGAAAYPALSRGEVFDDDTEAALRQWQASLGLAADGVAGPHVRNALGVLQLPAMRVEPSSLDVKHLFPAATRLTNISSNIPYVLAGLAAFDLTDLDMLAVALATIRAETEGFVPIPELVSKYNTPPGQPPFSAYDNRSSLGNTQPGDGARFRGRGYVQLTGRHNYETYGALFGLPLSTSPNLACNPEIAACLLAAFLAAHREPLRAALKDGDLKAARKVVNGGSHGFDRFKDTYENAQKLWSTAPAAAVKGMAARGPARRAPTVTAATLRRASLKVKADSIDLRDREYMPPPHSLAPQYPSDSDIKHYIGNYSAAGLVLDQGQEGACTGFGLACVINYLRWKALGAPREHGSVSPRMLYKLARRYDEYEGEDYEGSSCRGALKGWFHNGVCREQFWPYDAGVNTLPSAGWDVDAREQTLGVYYRVDIKSVVDMQAAINEVGAVYVSAFTHDGWDRVKARKTPPGAHKNIPVIEYDGVPSQAGGHAFALVGFNRDGFVIQNSWGTHWGAGGFAVLTYADWLAHAMDAWVVALGVPGVIAGRLVDDGATAGGASAGKSRPGWWSESKAYEHSIVLGNNGHVNHFLPRDSVSQTLQYQACVAPDTWFREVQSAKKRLVLYVHGGLNAESDAIDRARAMGRYFLDNQCYPLFLVWKSGLLETFKDILLDQGPAAAVPPKLAGNWLTDNLSDPVLEKTVGRGVAKPLWSEMKENAMLASEAGRGADLLIDAILGLRGNWGDAFELHLVGHSAGSIMLGRMLGNLAQRGMIDAVTSCHLYAPACTVAFANAEYAPHGSVMNNLYIDVLSDKRERKDNVAGVYQKSLLYFVSNALEFDARTPILGMAKVMDARSTDWDGAATTTEALNNWRQSARGARVTSRTEVHEEGDFVACRKGVHGADEKTEKASHGGFDNNVEVVGRTLERILGGKLVRPVDDLVGF